MWLLGGLLLVWLLGSYWVSGFPNDPPYSTCFSPANVTGCVTQYNKLFYRADKMRCYERFVCSGGFYYRTDCERICIDKKVKASPKAIELLKEIYKGTIFEGKLP